MAELAALDVKIQADVKQLIAGLDGATKGMTDFAKTGEASLGTLEDAFKALQRKQKEFTTGSAEFKTYSNALKQVGDNIATVKDVASKSFSGVKTASNGATQALTDLSRVAQDAPFGFVAISNNLNPLIESFGRLKAETGSGKAALSALGSSLMGAGGLGAGLSLVTSALTFATMGFGAWTRGLSKANETVEQHKNKLEDLKKQLAETTLKLREQTVIITDGNIPLETRKAALSKLRDQYEPYLKNISDEAILSGKAADAIGRINDALLAKMQLQALEQDALPIIKNLTTAQIQYGDALRKLGLAPTASIKEINAALSDLYKNQKIGTTPTSLLAQNIEIQMVSAQNNIAKFKKQYDDMIASIRPLIEQSAPLEYFDKKSQDDAKSYTDIIERLRKELAGIRVAYQLNQIDFTELSSNVMKAYKKAIEDLGKANAPIDVIKQIAKEIDIKVGRMKVEPTDVELVPPKEGVSVAVELVPPKEGVSVAPGANTGKGYGSMLAEQYAKDFEARMNALKANLISIYKGTIEGVFDTVGKALGEGLTGGDMLSTFFNGMFQVLGDGLVKLGEQAILASELMQALQNAFNSFFPGGGIAAGIALIALGSAMKGIKIGRNAEGTMNWGGGPTWVGEKGPELINLPRGASVIPSHVATGAIGGGSAMEVIIANNVIRGNDLYTIYKRASATYSRQT